MRSSMRKTEPIVKSLAALAGALTFQWATAAGSTYLGWRVFEQRCAECHGTDAAGTTRAPGLLARVSLMDEKEFTSTVLRRYQWDISAGEGASESAAREALVQDVLKGRSAYVLMPAWGDEPAVSVSILDLYAYLRGRAAGTVTPGRQAAPVK